MKESASPQGWDKLAKPNNHNELAKLLANAIETHVKGRTYFPPQHVETRLKIGQSLFGWAEQAQSRTTLQWNFSPLKVIKSGASNFVLLGTKTKQNIGIAVDGTFAGLSIYNNFRAIVQMREQLGQYALSNPLDRGSYVYSYLQLSASIASLTVDIPTAGAAALKLGGHVAPSLPLARALVPGLQSVSGRLSVFLNSKTALRFIAVANFAAAVAETWDSVKAFQAGNTGLGAGHLSLAVGSGILFGQAMYALLGGAATTASTGVGLPVAVIVVIVGLVFIGIGAALVYIFTKTPLQVLLENCFWGKSKNYAFWFEENNSERPPIKDRLNRAQQLYTIIEVQVYYRMELQEFMNMFNMPKLTLTRHVPFAASLRKLPRTYRYQFELPNFQQGVSEIHFALYTAAGFNENGQITNRPDANLSRLFAEKARQVLRIQGDSALIDLHMELTGRAVLIWGYEPQPGVLVPLRLLGQNGLNNQAAAGMVDDSPR